MRKSLLTLFCLLSLTASTFAQDVDSVSAEIDSLAQVTDSLAAEQRRRDSLAAAIAQEQQAKEDLTTFSQRSPRRAVNSHLHFLQADSYQPTQAARTLLAPNLPPEEREELAKMLKEIFDGAGFYVEIEDIPNEADYRDSSGRARYIVAPQFPDIYVQKYGEYWYYARRTVNAIPQIHDEIYPYGSNIFHDLVPKVGERRFLGLMLSQWLGILILLVGAVLVYNILNLVLATFIRRVLPLFIKNAAITIKDIYPVARPLSWLLVTILLSQFVPVLQFDIGINQFVIMGLRILSSIFSIVLASRIIDLVAKIAQKLASYTETTMDDQLVPLLVRIVRIIVVVFGIIFILQNLGVNVTALLAGVSIGGLALALAAQDTVKNFIGSISIFVDRPFQIGDFVEFGGIAGVVEEVGVRSTRIRSVGGEMISVPNGSLANEIITNISRRTHRRYATTLTVTYETTRAQITQFVEAIRELATQYQHTLEDSVTIQFKQFSDSSLDIYFSVSFVRHGYAEMLESQQELNLLIMKKAEELGVDFAFPSTTVYMHKDES